MKFIPLSCFLLVGLISCLNTNNEINNDQNLIERREYLCSYVKLIEKNKNESPEFVALSILIALEENDEKKILSYIDLVSFDSACYESVLQNRNNLPLKIFNEKEHSNTGQLALDVLYYANKPKSIASKIYSEKSLNGKENHHKEYIDHLKRLPHDILVFRNVDSAKSIVYLNNYVKFDLKLMNNLWKVVNISWPYNDYDLREIENINYFDTIP